MKKISNIIKKCAKNSPDFIYKNLIRIYCLYIKIEEYKKSRLIKKYREFDKYSLDVVVFPKSKIHINKMLPSEPLEGITYSFGPSGYLGDETAEYCVVPVAWENVNNYCHWTFSELPILFLAFASKPKNILLPNEIIN